MGDTFFKVFFISCFAILILAGLYMFTNMQTATRNDKEIEAYMNSRGKSKLPSSWRNSVGNGI